MAGDAQFPAGRTTSISVHKVGSQTGRAIELPIVLAPQTIGRTGDATIPLQGVGRHADKAKVGLGAIEAVRGARQASALVEVVTTGATGAVV